MTDGHVENHTSSKYISQITQQCFYPCPPPPPPPAPPPAPAPDAALAFHDHGIGRASSTKEGDGPAFHLYEFYRRVVREKTRWEFSTIPYVEIENDHLHSEFVHYCQWLIHNPIP